MQRARLHVSGWILGATLLMGCTLADQYTALRAPPHPLVSHPPSDIEIFSSSAPGRPHVDLGLIYVRVLGGWDAQIAALREAASEHGCDAVALSGGWGATCIVYTDVRPAPAAPIARPEVVIEVKPEPTRP